MMKLYTFLKNRFGISIFEEMLKNGNEAPGTPKGPKNEPQEGPQGTPRCPTETCKLTLPLQLEPLWTTDALETYHFPGSWSHFGPLRPRNPITSLAVGATLEH